MAQTNNHHNPTLYTEDSVKRNVVRRSSLEDSNRIYQSSTQETLKNGGLSPGSGKPYPFFVPSTVKSTLGSPVRFQSFLSSDFANAGRPR